MFDPAPPEFVIVKLLLHCRNRSRCFQKRVGCYRKANLNLTMAY